MIFKSSRNELKKKIEFMMEETDDIDELEKLSKIREELTLINSVSFKDVAKIVGGSAVYEPFHGIRVGPKSAQCVACRVFVMPYDSEKQMIRTDAVASGPHSLFAGIIYYPVKFFCDFYLHVLTFSSYSVHKNKTFFWLYDKKDVFLYVYRCIVRCLSTFAH